MLSPPPSTPLKPLAPSQSDQFKLPDPAMGLASPELPPKNGRRRNHSDIERRRRLRMNEKYDQLRTLVPSCREQRFARRGGDSGLHKLDILSEAVDYIESLHKEIAALRCQSEMPSPQLLALMEEAERQRPTKTCLDYVLN